MGIINYCPFLQSESIVYAGSAKSRYVFFAQSVVFNTAVTARRRISPTTLRSRTDHPNGLVLT
jgi:hypothetical protein